MKYAVELMINDPGLKKAITKELYPMVGKKFNISASRAERRIRYAITRGWLNADTEIQMLLFGYSVSREKGQPTNSEFICAVVEYILSSERNEE